MASAVIYSLNSGLWWSLTAVLLQCCSDSLKYPEHVLRNTEIHALIPEQQQEQETTWRQTKYLHCSDKQSGTKESVLWLRHVAHAARTVLLSHSWTSCLQYLGRWPFAFRQVKSWKWPWGFPTCCTCLTYPDIHSESPWRLTAHRVWRSNFPAAVPECYRDKEAQHTALHHHSSSSPVYSAALSGQFPQVTTLAVTGWCSVTAWFHTLQTSRFKKEGKDS